jgi:serine/threonine-protein kinase HipA
LLLSPAGKKGRGRHRPSAPPTPASGEAPRLGATECYITVVLPGAVEPVVAGRFALDADRRGDAVGRFVYGRRYLARPDAVEIDPVELKLAERAYETGRLSGVFGALRDAGPDSWGRRVLDRRLGSAGLDELDYLLHSPDDRAGALGFALAPLPHVARTGFAGILDLAKLQAVADKLVADEKVEGSAALAAEELLLIGTSMGGARPKATVEDADGLWLAKFNRADDRWNMARVEHAMLALGRMCGLDTAASRIATVGGRDVLLVKRFDRAKAAAGYTRARAVSALTLLRADESQRERWSYVALAEELRRIGAEPKRDAAELFRRMAFNALISNLDDHPRNHAAVAPGRAWRLAPAYDLVPSAPVGIERRDLAMSCGDRGRWAHAANLVSQSARFLLQADEAAAIVDSMEATVTARWYETARAAGISEHDCAAIRGAFAYPGFRAA